MELSKKEEPIIDLIKARGGVTIKELEETLGKNSTGNLGKLIQRGLIEKRKVKVGEGYNTKYVAHYFIKEEENPKDTIWPATPEKIKEGDVGSNKKEE